MASQGRPLPLNFHSVTHEFNVAEHEGSITLGRYPDGKPGKVAISLSKAGGDEAAYADVFGKMVSLGLQYGVPLYTYIDKFDKVRFEPYGPTTHPDIREVTSVLDYFSKWLASQIPVEVDQKASAVPTALRQRLPETRRAIIQRFQVGEEYKWWFTAGLYEDGTPGEIFIVFAKGGSTGSGFLDALAVATSLCLQYRVPLDRIVGLMRGVTFRPNGVTAHPQIRKVTSTIDCLAQWLDLKFGVQDLAQVEPEEIERVRVG